MTNPIETVLAAQAKAQTTVENARADAERAVDTARARGRDIRRRNADRTLSAVRRFETACAALLEKEVARLTADAQATRERFMVLAEKRLDDLIAKSIDDVWPR